MQNMKLQVAAARAKLQVRLVQAKRDMQQIAIRFAEVYKQYCCDTSSRALHVLAGAVLQQLSTAVVQCESVMQDLAMMGTYHVGHTQL